MSCVFFVLLTLFLLGKGSTRTLLGCRLFQSVFRTVMAELTWQFVVSRSRRIIVCNDVAPFRCSELSRKHTWHSGDAVLSIRG